MISLVQRGNGGPKDFMGVLRGSIAGLNGAGDVGRAPRQALGQLDFKIRVAFGAKVTAETVNGRLADTSCLGKACDAQAGGRGGVIGLDAKGNIVMEFNTPAMNRGYIDKNGKLHTAIYR